MPDAGPANRERPSAAASPPTSTTTTYAPCRGWHRRIPAERPPRKRPRDPEAGGIGRPLPLTDDAIPAAKAHRDGTNGRIHVPPLAPQDSPEPCPDKKLTTVAERNLCPVHNEIGWLRNEAAVRPLVPLSCPRWARQGSSEMGTYSLCRFQILMSPGGTVIRGPANQSNDVAPRFVQVQCPTLTRPGAEPV